MAYGRTRLVSLVGPLTSDRQAVHTTNLPLDPEQMLPVADVILLVSQEDASAMLFRYTAHGEFGGDTLHGTVREAQQQAADEYDEALIGWEQVPDEIGDAHLFAIRYANERLNGRGGWGEAGG